jgi:hypothetical protein
MGMSDAGLLDEAKYGDGVLRFDGRCDDGAPVTWYVTHRGDVGWTASRPDGRWQDHPSEDEVEDAIRVYDDVTLLQRRDVPAEVRLDG